MIENEESYRALANRNGWTYSVVEDRPYFMKNGNYATPDEQTPQEDREMLAYIISEGSEEMQKLILNCWANGLKISGPCSAIREYHDKQPIALHFAFIGNTDLVNSICENIKTIFPSFEHLCRNKNNGETRYDIDYALNGKELTNDESNAIFKIFNEQFQAALDNEKSKNKN